MTTYVFTPPTVDETPAGWDRLFIRVNIARGITVIQREDDTTYEARYPAQTELEDAKNFWMGGHENYLTQEEADYLTNQGYGAYISVFYQPGSYGYGGYGDGPYGGY